MHSRPALSFISSIVIGLIGQNVASFADEWQFLLPDNNVSSKPILEFRARPPTLKPLSLTGHGFVFLGKELDNGTTVFYQAAGFYPVNDTLKNIVYGPGTTKYQLPDMTADTIFRVSITPDQEELVKYIIKNWDTKTYSLAWQNCVSLERDVAKAIGLTVPEFNPADIDMEFPVRFVSALSAGNLNDQPIRYSKLDAQRMDAVRHNRATELKAVESAIKANEAASQKRMQDAKSQGTPTDGAPPVGGQQQDTGPTFQIQPIPDPKATQ